MGERTTKITQNTLIPLGVLAAIVVAVWAVSAAWQQAQGRLVDHERRIQTVEQKIDKVVDGVQRIEIRLGTSP